jgi:hypothetical protein
MVAGELRPTSQVAVEMISATLRLYHHQVAPILVRAVAVNPAGSRPIMHSVKKTDPNDVRFRRLWAVAS